MRTHSEFVFTCECGAQIHTQEQATTCEACKRQIRIIWPAEVV